MTDPDCHLLNFFGGRIRLDAVCFRADYNDVSGHVTQERNSSVQRRGVVCTPLFVKPRQLNSQNRAMLRDGNVGPRDSEGQSLLGRPSLCAGQHLAHSRRIEFGSSPVVLTKLVTLKQPTFNVVDPLFGLVALSSHNRRSQPLLPVLAIIKALVFALFFGQWHSWKHNITQRLTHFQWTGGLTLAELQAGKTP